MASLAGGGGGGVAGKWTPSKADNKRTDAYRDKWGYVDEQGKHHGNKSERDAQTAYKAKWSKLNAIKRKIGN